ncbi:MAG: hypothetical protein ACTSYJ_12250 [Candidatus Thorarchaeota archaeon]
MSRYIGASLTLLFAFLSVVTLTPLWHLFGFHAIIQTVGILIVASVGEHVVSGRGYYHYTNVNGVFVGRVPVWIPVMWVFVIQGALLFSLTMGLVGLQAILLSGFLCASLDILAVEPLLSAKYGMWRWTSVDKGYFKFIPAQVNRFTAPFGNYLTWLIFPILLNWLLGITIVGQMLFF